MKQLMKKVAMLYKVDQMKWILLKASNGNNCTARAQDIVISKAIREPSFWQDKAIPPVSSINANRHTCICL